MPLTLLLDGSQASGASQVRVNDHDLLLVVFGAASVKDAVDGLTKSASVCALVLGRADELERRGVRFQRLEVRNCVGVSLLLQVFASSVDGNNIVTVRLALEALDARAHLSLGDERSGARGSQSLHHGGEKRVEILTDGVEDLETVSSECLIGKAGSAPDRPISFADLLTFSTEKPLK